MLRLLKALRHEAPGVAETVERLGVKANGEAVAYVLKTLAHRPMAARLSVARVLAGQIGDGTTLNSPDGEVGRVSGVFKLVGQNNREARPGGRPARPSRSASSIGPRPAIR